MSNRRSVTSLQNPLVKTIQSLRQSKHRRRNEQILIDGARNILQAIHAKWQIECVVFSSEIANSDSHDSTLLDVAEISAAPIDWVDVPKAILSKIAYGQSSHSVAIANPPLDDLSLLEAVAGKPSSLILVLDSVEKPGNVGAVLRSGDAFGIDAMILSDPICDVWNPNSIRASAGAIFSVPLATGTMEQTFQWLATRGYSIYATRVDNAADYAAVPWPAKVAIVLGNEAEGLAKRWSMPATQAITIPTVGSVDSLNVSITAAVIAAEIYRLRRRNSNQS